jgi:glycosyltransferase involved in cell wall biosynthesis
MANSRASADMQTAILVPHVGHYHNARFRAYSERVEAVTVISTTAEPCFLEFSAKNDPICPYANRTLFADDDSYAQAVRTNMLWTKVGLLLNEIEPDLVAISGWATPEGFAALAWARSHRRRVVILSESQEVDGRRSAPREFIKRRIVRACDSALVGGRSHRDYLISLGIPESKICVGYNAVDNTYFQFGADAARTNVSCWRRLLGLPERYILASGRFVPKKNFSNLIKAYAKYVATKGSTHDLLILGDGPERSNLEKLVDDLGIRSRVQMPGFRGYDYLPVFYGLASFFVHVSTTEQWGLVVNEAMASGLPVIVSRSCGSARELVTDGITGYEIDPLNIDLLARRMELLATNETKCREMGSAAREVVTTWGPDRFAEGLVRAGDIAHKDVDRGAIGFFDTLLLKVLSRLNLKSVP